jgi:hypothetical protein
LGLETEGIGGLSSFLVLFGGIFPPLSLLQTMMMMMMMLSFTLTPRQSDMQATTTIYI